MWKRFQKNIIAGVIFLLPAIATIYVIVFLFGLIDSFLGSFITDVLRGLNIITVEEGRIYFLGVYTPFSERLLGIGFILTIMLIAWIGSMRLRGQGHRTFSRIDQAFRKIPIANSIYTSVEQIIHAFAQERTSFQNVVLVEYPRKGLYTVGFQTGESKGEVQRVTSKDCINVFLPTTPNPTSGWLVLIPKEDVIHLNMTVEQGLKFIISGGVVVPPDPEEMLEREHLETYYDEKKMMVRVRSKRGDES
ncbi:DUF502 domain-containing protein [Halalkalibacterium halodurans]|nr:DUF502 domain-containing protein [Halalkalibacterium halodurans]MDY7221890.1 DUF502 domain-containing protein [Halalkalibacterium halodurans]MDY7241166.1 DUF502 domain-containing protein [Halalkalibacterium halodurans]MED3648193.1 DUF502 domain-containing protein [Halalkalibacterium halodurans]MED4080598.1 DUF502 domain-containing protein [Halalkalibacterium halodurans]MED4083780.1 DUF502 domain-containing protein [Halalkalibacterium halodurans]